ncbi:MAG: dihydropteroate synthase, partial [Candidatus Cloacimonetes bacterium]|nr:dihydropteroate synthase [Candidatus Cloacimonadota bacterium]
RKSFIDKIEPAEPESRIEGSLAAGVAAMLSGVDIIRVHDVLAHKRFFKVLRAIAMAGVV